MTVGRYLHARYNAAFSKRDVLMVAIAFTAAATAHYQQTTEIGAFFVSNDAPLSHHCIRAQQVCQRWWRHMGDIMPR